MWRQATIFNTNIFIYTFLRSEDYWKHVFAWGLLNTVPLDILSCSSPLLCAVLIWSVLISSCSNCFCSSAGSSIVLFTSSVTLLMMKQSLMGLSSRFNASYCYYFLQRWHVWQHGIVLQRGNTDFHLFGYEKWNSDTVQQMAFSPCVALIHPDKFKWPALYGHESERQDASEHRTTESLCSETQYFQQLGPGWTVTSSEFVSFFLL